MPVVLRKNAATIEIRLAHIKCACTAPPKGIPTNNVQLLSESDTTNTNSTTVVRHEYPLFTVTASQTPPIVIPAKINDISVRSCTAWPEQRLQQSSDKLKMYSGEYTWTYWQRRCYSRIQ